MLTNLSSISQMGPLLSIFFNGKYPGSSKISRDQKSLHKGHDGNSFGAWDSPTCDDVQHPAHGDLRCSSKVVEISQLQ